MFIYLKKIDLYISIIIINTICPNTSENFVVAISAMVYLPCTYIESVYLISDKINNGTANQCFPLLNSNENFILVK